MTFPLPSGWLERLMVDPSADLAIANRRTLHVIEGENTPYGNLLWFATNTGAPFEPRAVPPTQRLCITDPGVLDHMWQYPLLCDTHQLTAPYHTSHRKCWRDILPIFWYGFPCLQIHYLSCRR